MKKFSIKSKKINEAAKMSTHYLEFPSNTEVNIDTLTGELEELYNLLHKYLPKKINNEIIYDISNTVTQLKIWKKEGTKLVSLNNDEWVPVN